ncbi:GPR endopeptidase [Halonatronum saccharophilum]|uniref:GPR endopeptidase n=1 Tax=Halonatronum saccharophilum TaxID=150060 RepID=UPI000485F15F|nr:GPR endopeptidase [Halonatronum saccharophilum]
MNGIENLATLTDLAVEARNMAVERTGGEIEGVSLEESQQGDANITRIQVLNQGAAQRIGKAPGNYITIESESLRISDKQAHENLSGILAQEMNRIIDYSALNRNNGQEPTILVVGLGNWNATPDALGPEVVHHILVTRHLYDSSPQDARQGMRPVCALAPGVLGITGVETAEIIKGLVDRVKPDLIIAIDSLAAKESKRLASTIQISDTGIYPGSGLGKNRIGITQADMGVPVIAMGIPTVISSVHIVDDTIKAMNGGMGQQQNNQQIIQQVLEPFMGDLVVTPKGVDQLIRDTSKIIAGGINVALHPDIGPEDVSLYLQ